MTPEQRAQRDIILGTKDVMQLWRNNVGVTPPLVDRFGKPVRPVRYGLANDSAQMNDKLKSADLIGWTPVTCGCGIRHAVFTSIEVKATMREAVDAPEAQRAWQRLVSEAGGLACFATRPVDVHVQLDHYQALRGARP